MVENNDPGLYGSHPTFSSKVHVGDNLNLIALGEVSKITFEELCLGIKQSLNDVLGINF